MVVDDIYKPGGTPRIVPSFCLVADLLGVKKRVRSCETREASNALCLRIHSLLSEFEEELPEQNDWNPWSYILFSDTIVFGYPILRPEDIGEPDLGYVVDFVQKFQLHMTLGGFLVRGGLSLGELYISGGHCFGKALVVAHSLEENEAEFPRIIVSPQVQKLIRKQMGFYSDPGQAPQVSDFLQDTEDDFFFVNYLDRLNIGDGTFLSGLEEHKKLLATQREEFSADHRVKEKLDWAIAYHNFFCEDQVVGGMDWEPTSLQKEELKVGANPNTRFRRLAERVSSDLSCKLRLPDMNQWPAFDE